MSIIKEACSMNALIDTVDAAPFDRGTLRSAYDEYVRAREVVRNLYAGSGSPTTNAIFAAMENIATASAALRDQLEVFNLTEALVAFNLVEALETGGNVAASGGASVLHWERFNALVRPCLD